MKHYVFENLPSFAKLSSKSEKIITCKDDNTGDFPIQPRHTHDFYEIGYVCGGSGVSVLDQSSFNIAHGSIWIVSPSVPHSYFSLCDLSLVNICFCPNPYQKSRLSSLINNHFSLSKENRIEYELLYFLLEYSQKEPQMTNKKSDIYLNTIIDFLLVDAFQNEEDLRHWSNLLRVIPEELATLTTKKAASICNYSVPYFCRAFKKSFNQTFTEYVDTIRLEKAKILLLSTDKSLEQISYITGFSHPSRFFRIFKLHFGITPSQFRKKSYHAEPSFTFDASLNMDRT